MSIAENTGISREDLALILLNARKYNPQTIADEGKSTVNRVDTAIYSSTSADGEMYIGPMDSTFTSGEESLSYRTDNPNPYKFSIDMVANTSFEDAVAAGSKVRSDATQSDFSDSDALVIR